MLKSSVLEMNLERKRPDGVQGLPVGWKREEVVRRRGLSAGKIDVFYSRCDNSFVVAPT